MITAVVLSLVIWWAWRRLDKQEAKKQLMDAKRIQERHNA